MDGEDRAFVDPSPVRRRHALAVVRIDREGSDPDRVGLGDVPEDVRLREHKLADHPAAFAHIERRRPVAGARKFVAGESPGADGGAHGFRHRGVVAEKPEQFPGVVLVRPPDLLAPVGRRPAPGPLRAGQSHGKLTPDAVVHVRLPAGEGVEIESDDLGVRGVPKQPARQFEARGIVPGGFFDRDPVRRILRHAQPPTVHHDLAVVLVRPGVFPAEQGEQDAAGVPRRKLQLRLRELMTGEALAVAPAALAPERAGDPGRGEQVALVRRVDEHARGEGAGVGRHPPEARAFLVHRHQPAPEEDAHARLAQQIVEDLLGDMRLVGPRAVVLHLHVIGEFDAAPPVVRRRAPVKLQEESTQRAPVGLVGVAEAEPARHDAAHEPERLDQRGGRPRPRRRHRGGHAARGGPVDDHVERFVPPGGGADQKREKGASSRKSSAVHAGRHDTPSRRALARGRGRRRPA